MQKGRELSSPPFSFIRMAQIAPVIATSQQAYDFLGISSTQAAGKLLNGTTTVASYIASLLQRTAIQIATWINYDYTQNQVQQLRFFGNGLQYICTPYPCVTVQVFKSWDPQSPTVAPVDIGTGSLVVVGIDPYKLYRNDNNIFQPNLEYFVQVLQDVDPVAFGGWPQDVIEVQVEMVASWYKGSFNLQGDFDTKQLRDPGTNTMTTKLDMNIEWQKRLRPYKRYEP